MARSPRDRPAALLLIETIGSKGSDPRNWPKLLQDVERRYGVGDCPGS